MEAQVARPSMTLLVTDVDCYDKWVRLVAQANHLWIINKFSRCSYSQILDWFWNLWSHLFPYQCKIKLYFFSKTFRESLQLASLRLVNRNNSHLQDICFSGWLVTYPQGEPEWSKGMIEHMTLRSIRKKQKGSLSISYNLWAAVKSWFRPGPTRYYFTANTQRVLPLPHTTGQLLFLTLLYCCCFCFFFFWYRSSPFGISELIYKKCCSFVAMVLLLTLLFTTTPPPGDELRTHQIGSHQ